MMFFGEFYTKGSLILVFSCLIVNAGAQDDRLSWCIRFKECFDESQICKDLFGFLKCELVIEEPSSPGCGISPVTGPASEYSFPRIVGGLNALEGEFPWSVRLEDERGSMDMCGGTILDSNTVLTAAHCVSSMKERPEDLMIGYGSRNLTALKYVRATKITVHPNYTANTNSDYDIAVLSTEENLPLSESLTPVCMPESRYTYHFGLTCIVTGWGKTKEVGFSFPELLQKAAVPLVSLGLCQEAYRGFGSLMVAERQLCAGYYEEGSTDACQGDSGGPLVCAEGDRWVLHGIVSTGNGCGRSRFPGVYTYVPQYVNWIKSFMN